MKAFEAVQILREDGSWEEGTLPSLPDETLLEAYEWMVFARSFDHRAVSLQRQGRLGTYPPLAGQEAAQVGSALALQPEDWLFPSYREAASLFVRGLPPERLLLYWMGREEGSIVPEGIHLFPVSIPIASQVPHAMGMALAARLRGDTACAIVYFGDGATSEGDFHEAANFAGVFQVPLVLFCQNNQYAISVPLNRQTASETLAQKALAYGFEGVRVDGNDLLGVYEVTQRALERARAGKGPTLIEAVTYRYGSHTTADDASRYRPAAELESWQRERDPVLRFRRFLERRGLWDQAAEDALTERLRQRIATVVEQAEAFPPPDPRDLFRHMYHSLPPHLEEQMTALLQELSDAGEEG